MSIYMDNMKVGDERTTFDEMTHDGSAPGNAAIAPNPPILRSVQ